MTAGQDNAVDYWWTMRALLLAMHKWVKGGVEPPPSQYPRLQDRTLVAAASVAMPKPGVPSPRALDGGTLRELVPDRRRRRRTKPLLVPEVNEDGNERAVIRCRRLPCRSRPTPAGTSGQPANGSPGELVSLSPPRRSRSQ